VTRGSETATLNVYTTGKVSAGGKRSGLLDLVERWLLSRAATIQQPPPEPDITPRLGTDEAGKGDYFGPLVVAGVRLIDGGAARHLQGIGVRDSKMLSATGATDLAGHIAELIGSENRGVVALQPPEYERRRRAAGNVIKLLAQVNIEILRELEDKVELMVVDEFGTAASSLIEPSLPEGVRLVVQPRAEDDVAVAAASILARARYLEEMEALSEEVGFELPRGATHVVGAARRVVEARGVEGLGEVAKVHFATTKQVLEG
jgi:ribonuclease HIII